MVEKDHIQQGLVWLCERHKLNATKLAYEADRVEGSARQWFSGSSLISADALLRLMRRYPDFAQRLLDHPAE